MASVPAELLLSYPVPSQCRGAASMWALHEPKGSYEAPRRAASSIPVGLHLKPGQKGTKHLVEEYGDRLVCVRYRYDAARKKRIKTVELVVAESDWQPRFGADEIVAVRVAFTDVATRHA